MDGLQFKMSYDVSSEPIDADWIDRIGERRGTNGNGYLNEKPGSLFQVAIGFPPPTSLQLKVRNMGDEGRQGTPLQTAAGNPSFETANLLRHGPPVVFRRFFARSEAECRKSGVALRFGTFSELIRANEENASNWRSLVPVLDPRWGSLGENSFCLLGVNNDGHVVAAQAARLYDFGLGNLKTQTECGRLLIPPRYPHDGGDWKGEHLRFRVCAPAAIQITGKAVYSGATWYRPDYRGQMLSSIVPRTGRALAYTMWGNDYFFSFVETALMTKKMLDRYGYSQAEFGVTVAFNDQIIFDGGLIWMHSSELITDLSRF